MEIDGMSSSSEFSAMQKMMEQMKSRMFKRMDANGDGGVDVSELTRTAKKAGISADELIKEYDADQDGKLNTDETDVMMHEIGPQGRPPPPSFDGRSMGVNAPPSTSVDVEA